MWICELMGSRNFFGWEGGWGWVMGRGERLGDTFGNLMRTPWERDGNTLGRRRKLILQPPHLASTPKKKTGPLMGPC
jgi:hypothetical protein